MPEPTKKGNLHPKTNKKLQQDGRRGVITIKSNPIHTGWATHKLEDNYTTEVLPQEWKFWVPHQAPQPGGLTMGRGDPRESGFETQWGLTAGLPQDWGKQKLHSWRAHTRSCAHQDPGKEAVTPQETGPDLLATIGGSSAEVGAAVAHCRDKDTAGGSSGEYSLVWALLEGTISCPRPGPTQQPVGSSAGTPWAKQLTGQEHSPTHQQKGHLKSSEPTALWTCPLSRPCMPQGQDPAPPTSGHVPDPPNRKPAQAS